MLNFFHYINFKSVAWRFQYLLKYFKIQIKLYLQDMTDTNLRSIRNFANKKTIKQFLQPMMEQMGGGGECAGRMCCFSDVSFSVATVFLCSFFLNSPMRFLGVDSVPFLLYIMCISSKSQTMFWAQNFRDVQMIPNFFRYPAYL